MRIATISKVKNEADIIESFVRYHAGIVDLMVFIENGSADETLRILSMLQAEGYPIIIFDESDHEFDELRFINQYAGRVLESEQIDWLVPIDADEFLYADGENPKMHMEKWKTDTVYLVMWRTYIWNAQTERKNGFVPDRFDVYRDEKCETFKKVIVPGQLYGRKKLLINHGNHDVIGIDVKKESDSVIKFAHYPVRSQEQFKAQIVVNAIMQMSRRSRKKSEAWHWEDIYNAIRKKEELRLEDISMTYAMTKSDRAGGKKIPVCSGSLKHSYLNDINLKYEPYADVSAFDNLMHFSERLARWHAKDEKAKTDCSCNSKKRVVIFGVGSMAEVLVDAINTDLYEIIAYADSNTEGNSRTFRGEKVFIIDDIIDMEFEYVVITSSLYFEEMKRKLLSLGILKNIYFITDFIKKGWMGEIRSYDESCN